MPNYVFSVPGACLILLAASGCAGGGGTDNAHHTGGNGVPSLGAGGHPSGDACAPGEQIACACAGGNSGTQVCFPDGSGYGTCACGSDEAGVASLDAETGDSPATPDAGPTPPPPDAGMLTTCPTLSPTEMDLSTATIYSNPPDLASWPITTTLTEVDFTNDGVHLVFDKQDGSSRWPDVIPPGWTGPLQYTLGMVECIGGTWYTSAVIEFWYGLSASGGNVAQSNQIAVNWYYDTIRWGMLAGRQPATGEIVGIFVAAGNLRDVTTDDPSQSPVMERSNVVLVPMPDVSGATHSF